MLENIYINIRKDERCFFERYSLRKTFLRCTLCALLRRIVHSYVVYISIIVVSLIAILIQNSNPSVNIRKRLRILEKHARCSLRKKFYLVCNLTLCPVTDSLYHITFYHIFSFRHLSITYILQKKKMKK